jgi:hypothetical protein
MARSAGGHGEWRRIGCHQVRVVRVPHMWLTIATWTGAIATVVLAVGAGFTVYYARKAFREQSEEVGLLQKQAEREQEDRRQEAESRRRAQAALVYVVLEYQAEQIHRNYAGGGIMTPGRPSMVTATVHNTAERPIYGLRVQWVTGVPGVPDGSEHHLGTLGPRSEVAGGIDVQGLVELEKIELAAFFRDAAGLSWTLLPDGQLEQVLPQGRSGREGSDG